MKLQLMFVAVFILGIGSPLFSQTATPSRPEVASTQPSKFTVEYPKDEIGVLLGSSVWTEVSPVFPARTHAKHSLVSSLTYGAVPAEVVTEYEGLHAEVRLSPGRPVFCVCHIFSIPGTPVIVRLHPKKNSRMLDGGRIPILGGKIAEATKSDLVEIDVSQPESTVWLIRPKEALQSGEYALMLGTQNMSIFPFTVSAPESDAPALSPGKH